jgi:CRP/FNR family transcriptional regulator, anaerobic regulatory protein
VVSTFKSSSRGHNAPSEQAPTLPLGFDRHDRHVARLEIGAVNAATPRWQELFPALAAGDTTSRALMDAARPLAMAAGQTVFRAGSPCESYLLLLSGSVRVQVLGEGGREAVLYRVLPGQSCVLTTCCVLAGDPYPAEGFAETPVWALAIGKGAFDRAMESAPAFRRFVFANLGNRIAEVIARMEEVAFRPVERRLAAWLLTRVGGARALTVTHREIAVELGTAREVVSRHLKRFESAGLVHLGRSSLEVRDPQGLQRLANPPL